MIGLKCREKNSVLCGSGFSHTNLSSELSPSGAARSARGPHDKKQKENVSRCRPAITLNIPLTWGSLVMHFGERQPPFRNESHLRGQQSGALEAQCDLAKASLHEGQSPISRACAHHLPLFPRENLNQADEKES